MGIARDFGGHLYPQPNTCSDGEPSSKTKGSSEQSSAYGGVYKDCYFSTLMKHRSSSLIPGILIG